MKNNWKEWLGVLLIILLVLTVGGMSIWIHNNPSKTVNITSPPITVTDTQTILTPYEVILGTTTETITAPAITNVVTNTITNISTTTSPVIVSVPGVTTTIYKYEIVSGGRATTTIPVTMTLPTTITEPVTTTETTIIPTTTTETTTTTATTEIEVPVTTTETTEITIPVTTTETTVITVDNTTIETTYVTLTNIETSTTTTTQTQTYILMVYVVGNGCVSASQSGNYVTLIATPAHHNEFKGWYNGLYLISHNASITILMDDDKTIIARFNEGH